MKRYETYKDSGAEWIGEIPESWKTVKIKFITDIYTGNSLNSDLKILFESENENDLPYVSTKDIDIDNNTLNYNNGLRIPLDNSYYKVAPEGSFLLCIEGANAGKKMAYVEQDCCFVNKLACFNFPNKFLFYFAQSNSFKTQFFNSISGLIGGVSISVLKEFVSTIPSPKEQTQIAAYLDHKTGLIDSIIAQKEALIKKLKEQRQAIINEAVTKGLNPDVKLKDSGIEWLGEIPEHWVISKFKYFATIRNGKDQKGVLVENGKYPILGTGGEFGRASEFLYDKPSVLLGRKGTINKPQFIEEPFWTVDTLFYTEIHEDVSPKYLFYLSTLIPFNLLQESSAVPSMTQDKLHNVFLTKPIKEEQNKIVKHIENEMNKMDLLISKAKESIQKLKEYRQSLISEAVTGKIDVRDWQAPKS